MNHIRFSKVKKVSEYDGVRASEHVSEGGRDREVEVFKREITVKWNETTFFSFLLLLLHPVHLAAVHTWRVRRHRARNSPIEKYEEKRVIIIIIIIMMMMITSYKYVRKRVWPVWATNKDHTLLYPISKEAKQKNNERETILQMEIVRAFIVRACVRRAVATWPSAQYTCVRWLLDF